MATETAPASVPKPTEEAKPAVAEEKVAAPVATETKPAAVAEPAPPKTEIKKKQVVVVGGGGYGAIITKALSTALDKEAHGLTLISARDYYLHLVGMPRATVTDKDHLEKKILIPYDQLFTGGIGTRVKGVVTTIKKNADGKSGSVTLATGEVYPWDVLILTPGNKWEGALDLPDTVEESTKVIEEWRKKYKEAKSIILVGGGAVGIELSGELRDKYDVRSPHFSFYPF
jgi:apoptosis-inducing factor 2